jgi:hypothetical protein
MMKQIKVTDLCSELEQKLVELHYSDDSMEGIPRVRGACLLCKEKPAV